MIYRVSELYKFNAAVIMKIAQHKEMSNINGTYKRIYRQKNNINYHEI